MSRRSLRVEPSLSRNRRTAPIASAGRRSSNAAFLDGGVPAIVTVEVPQHRPHPVDGCVDHGALLDFDHRRNVNERPFTRRSAA